MKGVGEGNKEGRLKVGRDTAWVRSVGGLVGGCTYDVDVRSWGGQQGLVFTFHMVLFAMQLLLIQVLDHLL